MSIRERLFEQAERYVSLSIMSNAPLRDDVGEHKQLMRAALNREVDKTIELNRLHISRTSDKVAASLAANRVAEQRRGRNQKKVVQMNVQVQAGPVTIPAAQLAAFVARLFAATGLSARGSGESCERPR